MFDPVYFKKQFPLFDCIDNQTLVYLDNAATTQKPQCVIDAIVNFYTTANGNANRSSHRLARAATSIIERTRLQAAQFIGAESADAVVFTSGATESLNIIANGLGKQLSTNDEVVVSIAEHHANLVPWQEVCHSANAKLVFADIGLADIDDLINKKTKVISVTAASNTLGSLTDLDKIWAIKKQYPEIIIVLDGSQLMAHQAVNVKNMLCDFFVCSAHKFYGPTGVGLLYGHKSLLSTLSPSKFGGEMIANVTLDKSTYVAGPERFEGGTSSLAAIAALDACFGFWNQQNREQITCYENSLIDYLYQKIEKLCEKYPEIRLLSKRKNNIGIVTLASDQYSMADIGFWLDEANIAVRVGDHCTQPLLRALNAKSAMRLSIAAYNTYDDIDQCVASIEGFLDKSTQFTSSEEVNRIDYDISSLDYKELYDIHRWQHRYKKIMQWGNLLPPKPYLRTQENIVSGCESLLWLAREKKEGKYYFDVDSDSTIVKGLAVVMLCRMNGKTKEEILLIDFQKYFSELGLEKHLSESRINGVGAMLRSMLDYIRE